MKYFVMLAHPNGRPVPVIEDAESGDNVTMLFETEEEAESVMKLMGAAQAWGYEVYPWPL